MARLFLLGGCLTCLMAGPTVASARSWQVTARGQVLTTHKGKPVPLAGVRIYLMDDDPAFDEELTAGRTDRGGRFRLEGRGGDTQWLGCDQTCSRPDVYVRIELPRAPTDSRWRVRTHTTRVLRDRAGHIDLGRIVVPGLALQQPRPPRLVRAVPRRRLTTR